MLSSKAKRNKLMCMNGSEELCQRRFPEKVVFRPKLEVLNR